MSPLSESICEACSVNAICLTEDEIDSLKKQTPDWEIIFNNGIKKLSHRFTTKNYSQSVTFTDAVAKLAETANHHPQILLEYSSVTVVWWSHKIKGLHKNDFIMAAKTSAAFDF